MRATHELLGPESAAAVGVDAIAERAGTSKMAIYREFGDKRGLLCAYVDNEAREFGAWLQDRMGMAPREPMSRVLFVFDALESFVLSPDFCGCRFINAACDNRNDPDVRAGAWHAKQQFRATLIALAQNAGIANPASVALQLSLLVDGVLVAMMMSGGNDRTCLGEARAAALALVAKAQNTGST